MSELRGGSCPLSRRALLSQLGSGFGLLGLAGVLSRSDVLSSAWGDDPVVPKKDKDAAPFAQRPPHFAPRAKRVIFLFMNGGPSQVDTFDPKPLLTKHAGKRPPEMKGVGPGSVLLPSPWKFSRYGASGIEVSRLFPKLGAMADDLCVIRSMHTNNPTHAPALLFMNTGETQSRPSMGSWLTYGLGSENQNLPGFVVLSPGKPLVGEPLWSSSFLPGSAQGTFINTSRIDPKTVIQDVTNTHLAPDEQRRQLDLVQEMNRHHLRDRDRDDQLEARIQSMELAFRMQFASQEAFDLK
ncbi:MAG: DUF1501 domain-containing protein, partial [Acidobacteria bacterium]|nr:DUF1501 domain-containing protein [Acidobacteriota bacterium]